MYLGSLCADGTFGAVKDLTDRSGDICTVLRVIPPNARNEMRVIVRTYDEVGWLWLSELQPI